MPEQNKNRVTVDDAKERAQLAEIQKELKVKPMSVEKAKSQKLTPNQKKLKKKNKKYNVMRFSNWLLWITMVALIAGAIFIYTNFLNLGTTQYWGKDGGYSRIADRGPLAQSAFDKINSTHQDTVKIEQRGPVVNLLVSVTEGTSVDEAKKFTDNVIIEFLTELGDARSAEAPYGNTFMKYELNIQVTQKNLAKPNDESLNKIGDLGGEQQKIAYPFFGTVHKGVMTWTNNVA